MGGFLMYLAECPEWVLKLARNTTKKEPGLKGNRAPFNANWRGNWEVPEGQRNASMISFVGWMISQGGTLESIYERAAEANSYYCKPPLPDHEVSYMVRRAIQRWVPLEDQQEGYVKPVEYYINHSYRASEFAKEFKDRIAYVPEQSVWAAWVKNAWHMKPETELVHIYPALSELNEDLWKVVADMKGELKSFWIRWAKKCSNSETFSAVIKQARSLVTKPFDEFNTDDYLLNCSNGIVNLKTGELLKHDPKYWITQQTNIEYDPNCNCDNFLSFLDDITNGNQELIKYLQKLAGLCLTGSISERSVFIFYGHGRNGKSTFLRILLDLMGNYATAAATNTFTDKNSTAIRNDLAALHDVRLVTTSEIGKDGTLDSTLIKEITGGDPITCRFLYRETFSYIPRFKLIMALNQRPNLSVKDQAIWDRVHLVPFTVRIPESKLIPQEELMAKFKSEMPGIMSWAVKGAQMWIEEKLQKPKIVKEAIADYKQDIDPNTLFLETRFTDDLNDAVASQALFEDYKNFARQHNLDLSLGFDTKAFGRTIMKRFKTTSKRIDGQSKKVYQGFKLPN